MAESNDAAVDTPRSEPTIAARAFRDPHLASFFPGILLCDELANLVDADATALELLPNGNDQAKALKELVAPAIASLVTDSDLPSVRVGIDAPPIEGVATMAHVGGQVVVVAHIRDPRDSPGVRRLVDQNRTYEAVLRTGPVFVHVYDAEMNSRWASSTLRPELGYQPTRQLSAEENYSFVHPDDVPSVRLDHGASADAHGESARRIRVKSADGEWHWLAVLAADLLDDPDVGSVVVHAWDVTEEVAREQEVEDARRRLASLIDTLDEAVVIVADERVAFANTRVNEMFPTTAPAEELIGTPVSELQSRFADSMAEPQAFAASTAAIVAKGEPVRNRLIETGDGRTLEQTFLAIRVGERESSRVWVHRDITEQLQLRRRQEQLLELERQARRHAEEQAKRLGELDELKTELVATVSHELRTPLSAISSYVELLLDPAGPSLSDEQRSIADSIQRGASRLTRLVDDLLELARLQSGTIEVEWADADVAETVTEAADEVRAALAGDIEIVVDVEPGPMIETDRERLIQILNNLLGNAINFAHAQVTCTARVEGGSWSIEVGDDGPGVPAGESELIFEPFYRGAKSGGAPTGTGLGLAISARLAKRLRGRLTLGNSAAGGATAQLILPIEAPDETDE